MMMIHEIRFEVDKLREIKNDDDHGCFFLYIKHDFLDDVTFHSNKTKQNKKIKTRKCPISIPIFSHYYYSFQEKSCMSQISAKNGGNFLFCTLSDTHISELILPNVRNSVNMPNNLAK